MGNWDTSLRDFILLTTSTLYEALGMANIKRRLCRQAQVSPSIPNVNWFPVLKEFSLNHLILQEAFLDFETLLSDSPYPTSLKSPTTDLNLQNWEHPAHPLLLHTRCSAAPSVCTVLAPADARHVPAHTPPALSDAQQSPVAPAGHLAGTPRVQAEG